MELSRGAADRNPAAEPASLLDRALGALYGLAIGDALGMPTQTLDRATVERLFGEIDRFHPGPVENEVSAGMPPGRVTDDTEQALIVARLVVEGGGVPDPRRLADELLAWERGKVAVGAADLLGPSTKRALSAAAAGVPLTETGRWGDTNGAAMRITPVGIATAYVPLGRLVDTVVATDRITHDTGIAHAGAAAVAAAVSAGVAGEGFDIALDLAVAAAGVAGQRGHYAAGADVAARIRWACDVVAGAADVDTALDLVERLVGTSVATQESVPAAFALAALAPADPWQVCRWAAGLGGDSDTVAGMAGAVLGGCCGVSAFPAEAVATARRVNDLDLEPLARALLALR